MENNKKSDNTILNKYIERRDKIQRLLDYCNLFESCDENCLLYGRSLKCEHKSVDQMSNKELDCALSIINDFKDIVNHPSHYETGNMECIEVMEETQGTEAVKNFCICNAFKYLYRWKNKNGVEDIKKAKWYIDKFLELEEANEDGNKEM